MADQGADFVDSKLSDLFESYDALNIPIAFANKNKTIIWASEKFEELVDGDVKEKDFIKLFNISNHKFFPNSCRTEENLFWSLNIFYKHYENRTSYYVLFINKKSEASEKVLSQVKGIKSFAHDINNILTSITNSAALLKNKSIPGAGSVKLIDNIETDAHRAADILQQVLTGGLNKESVRMKVDLNKLLIELYNSLSNMIRRSISVELDIDENLSLITANYSDIYRVLLNLCINSSEAIRRKGKIKVSAKNVLRNELPAGYNSKARAFVKISVIDNGSGIRKKNLDKIFTPGYSTKNRLRDSGLGLHIVKSIIEDHSGVVEVSGKWLRGSEFNIYLPARELYESSDLASVDDKTILIADDENSILELLTDLLESYDYKVINALNGEEIINAYRNNNNVDLMIIDRKMPIMDGLESTKRLRQMEYNKPIILTTGSQSSVKNLNPGEISVDKIIMKPYDFEQLLIEVKKLLC